MHMPQPPVITFEETIAYKKEQENLYVGRACIVTHFLSGEKSIAVILKGHLNDEDAPHIFGKFDVRYRETGHVETVLAKYVSIRQTQVFKTAEKPVTCDDQAEILNQIDKGRD